VVLAAMCATLVAERSSHADPPPGFYHVVWMYDAQPSRPNTFAANEGTRSFWARLGDSIEPLETVLWTDARSPGSQRLVMRFAGPSCGRVALSIGSPPLVSAVARIATNRTESRPLPCLYSVPIDAARASAVRALPHVVVRDVASIGDGITASFAASRATYHPGEEVSIGITMRLPASSPDIALFTTPPVVAPFVCDITRNGRPVLQRVDGIGVSGAEGFVLMQAVAHDETPVGAVWDLSALGHYVAQCRYAARFDVPGHESTGANDRGVVHEFAGRAEFDVR
jgi:hypothetical protein